MHTHVACGSHEKVQQLSGTLGPGTPVHTSQNLRHWSVKVRGRGGHPILYFTRNRSWETASRSENTDDLGVAKRGQGPDRPRPERTCPHAVPPRISEFKTADPGDHIL